MANIDYSAINAADPGEMLKRAIEAIERRARYFAIMGERKRLITFMQSYVSTPASFDDRVPVNELAEAIGDEDLSDRPDLYF